MQGWQLSRLWRETHDFMSCNMKKMYSIDCISRQIMHQFGQSHRFSRQVSRESWQLCKVYGKLKGTNPYSCHFRANIYHLERIKKLNQNQAPSVISPPPGCTGSSHQSGATWSQRSGSARSQTPGTFLGTALQCSTIALLRMCCKTHTQMMEILHCELKDCEVNS